MAVGATCRLVIVQTNCGTAAEARSIARLAVESRLAACANISAPVTSIYRWQGKVEEAAEWIVYLKTVETRVPALEAFIRQQHSYDLPCILVLPVAGGEARYVEWLAAASSG